MEPLELEGSDGMSPRGSADILTRTTAIVAILFVITSISLTILSLRASDNRTLNFDDIDLEITNEDLLEDLPELPQCSINIFDLIKTM